MIKKYKKPHKLHAQYYVDIIYFSFFDISNALKYITFHPTELLLLLYIIYYIINTKHNCIQVLLLYYNIIH